MQSNDAGITYKKRLFKIICLDEVRPGLGYLDDPVFLKELSWSAYIPLMMEHLQAKYKYYLAAEFIRLVGVKNGINM